MEGAVLDSSDLQFFNYSGLLTSLQNSHYVEKSSDLPSLFKFDLKFNNFNLSVICLLLWHNFSWMIQQIHLRLSKLRGDL